MTIDKIPIGKLLYSKTLLGDKQYDYVAVKLKKGIKIKDGDIITLDMIEPYESEAVRKVAEYISNHLNLEYISNHLNLEYVPGWRELCLEHAKKIVELVHEAEDADE